MRFRRAGINYSSLEPASRDRVAHWCRHQTADPEAVLSASFGMAPRQQTELGRSRGRSRLFCEREQVSGSSIEVRGCWASSSVAHTAPEDRLHGCTASQRASAPSEGELFASSFNACAAAP